MIYENNKHINELLLDYRFNDLLFHSIEYDPKWQVICFGTNKGTILSFFIKISDDQPYFDSFEDTQGYKDSKQMTHIINDSDI